MLNTTLGYLDHFARFTQKENVEAVERLLSAHKDLEKFERAQLGKELESFFSSSTLAAPPISIPIVIFLVLYHRIWLF